MLPFEIAMNTGLEEANVGNHVEAAQAVLHHITKYRDISFPTNSMLLIDRVRALWDKPSLAWSQEATIKSTDMPV